VAIVTRKIALRAGFVFCGIIQSFQRWFSPGFAAKRLSPYDWIALPKLHTRFNSLRPLQNLAKAKWVVLVWFLGPYDFVLRLLSGQLHG